MSFISFVHDMQLGLRPTVQCVHVENHLTGLGLAIELASVRLGII